MKSKICTGIPELNIPPNEPIIIDNLIIHDTNNVKLYLRDIKIYGFCDFIINSFHKEGDIDKLHFDFNINIKHVRMNTTYDINLHILTQIACKGRIQITVGK